MCIRNKDSYVHKKQGNKDSYVHKKQGLLYIERRAHLTHVILFLISYSYTLIHQEKGASYTSYTFRLYTRRRAIYTERERRLHMRSIVIHAPYRQPSGLQSWSQRERARGRRRP